MSDFSYGKPGELLFHYTTAATAFEHIVPGKKIRLSPYSLMRDPLEARHWPEPPAYFVDPENDDQEKFEIARMGVVFQAKEAARLLSLTVDATDYGEDLEPFGRGYSRANMWQLYGDNHRGVCLAFDRRQLISELKGSLADSAQIIAKPVEYVRALQLDSLPSKPPADLSIGAFRLAVDDYIAANADRLLFSKLRDWAGENEFRFVAVSYEQEQGPIDVPFGESLRAVICGHALPPWQRAGGEVICREAGEVDLARCIWHGRRPMIVYDRKGFGERR